MSAQFAVPEIVTRTEQHLAVVRDHVSFDEIAALYDRAFPLIFSAISEAGLAPTAPPMGIVHGEPGETLDLSVAVPVASPFGETGDGRDTGDGSGAVTGEYLPEGRVVTLLVQGDYAQLSAAYEYLFNWVASEGLTPIGISWEQYLTEPAPDGDPADNQTLLGIPVE